MTLPRVFLVLWLCAVVSAQAQNKQIRLRNERISTPPPERGLVFRAQADTQPASGLYMIQFTDRLDPAWREELRTRQVELLRYIPDDTFVARLNGVKLEDIRALPFVHWVGEYRTEHKIHNLLRIGGQGGNRINPSAVAILFSPSASPLEIAAVRARFQSVQQESNHRFGAVLRGTVAPGQLQRLAESPAVLWIEPGPKMKLNDEISSKLVGGEWPGHLTFTQPNGFDGRGVKISVADSGLHLGEAAFMHDDLAGRTPAFFYYGTLTDASDEHAHGTHVAGIIAGNGTTGTTDEKGFRYGLGVAPGASIITQRIFDGEGGYEAPPSYETLTRDAVQAGADIGSNSWGDDTQGRYDVSAAEFDALVRDADSVTPGDQPYILEFSAGNAGPGAQTVGSPAVAKNVIATGASQNDRFDFFIYTDGSEAMADFSSRGPCEDGRIKPDVVAPGTWIASLRSPVGNDGNAWLDIDSDYLYMGGTSQAGPQVSGAAAVFVQYYRETYASGTPSPALVKAALIHSAVDMDDSFETLPTPNMDEGWGRVDLTQIILSPRSHEYLDQSVKLTTGQTYERSLIISSAAEPLKITLVYTDVPGFPAAIPALVNDLDLEVVGPDGRVYRGNQFDHGQSVPDAPASDNINNVEGLYIAVPQPGEYTVRVRARNVVQDARRDTPAIDQDFALVMSGIIPSPEAGIVLLDRSRYTAPGRIKVKLFDLDLAGQPNASVIIRSATEPNGLTLVLKPINPNGVFTGSVATATGPASNDALLQIAHLNYIRADYFDASEHVTNSANAVADLLPPVITNVSITNEFGEMVITWTTDEPANSVVRFNTNSTLNRAITNLFLTTTHTMEFPNLIAGRTYFFVINSTDAAGNIATNNNGVPLSFVAVPASTVLLVDAYVPVSGEIAVPLSDYTNALAQTGVSFDVWNTETRGQPLFGNLRSYQIVMWRINDNFLSADVIPSAQQSAIQQYVNAGGGFFMSSMDILSRLLSAGSAAFVTNVLHVQRFIRNPDFFSYCAECDEDFRVPTATGVANDVIGDGMNITLNYGNYPEIPELGLGPDFSDTFGPATNASPFLVESVSDKATGLRFPRTGQDSTGRVVFAGFPLDAIPATGAAPNNRSDFLRRVFQFLSPGLDGVGTLAFSQGAYRLPDLISIEVGDSDLAGLPSATVSVWSSSATGRIPVTLHETIKPGLFRGSIALLSGTNTPAPGRLRANHGDTLFAEYFDASGQAVVQSIAIVDAVPAIISGLEAVPEFQNAEISWNTSERTDALVQFGESLFLGRTAYMSDLGMSHAVQLTGLIPDRTYYYKIVSRDAAGNVTEDDNNGQMHTFHTLMPLVPPFIDNLESGATNWSVFNGEDTQFKWELASPNNGKVSSAHSGSRAWVSNRLGEPADYIDTFLISPAIDLTGGNVATLKFWHAYDFAEDSGSDILNGGELLIVTNSVSAPATLAEYFGQNSGWEEEEFDLTPYIGSVIFLVWHHQLFSIERAPRPGWAVDDISVTISNIPPGTIAISNNLAQARFTVSGPVVRPGQGVATNFPGLPPGRYTVTWNAVPYYLTPPQQTNILAPASLLQLTGQYTFPDANHNGISDLWELQFFGSLSPVRSCLTDSDNDGFPDCAEFFAGTDPTRTNSYLRLAVPIPQNATGKLLFQWSAVPGRDYRILGTRDYIIWSPMHDYWYKATTGTMSVQISQPDSSEPFAFRLEVRP